MRLVLCDAEDAAALWAARALGERGVALEVVTSAELMRARFEHRLLRGRPSTLIELGDGRRIDARAVRGTLCRLTAPRAELLPPVPPADRDYAIQELWALWLSWLHGLPEPVLGAATPAGLGGPWLSAAQWRVRAAQAGLATFPLVGGDAPAPTAEPPGAPLLFVVHGAVVGPPAPSEAIAGSRALAEAAGCSLLGVWFGGGWRFAGATPMPDLRRGGAALVAVLARALGAPR
jgi:hypothetical protein